MILTTTVFENEGWMPDDCAGFGADRSPELCASDYPENTVSFAITMDDLGHPIEPGFNHWVAWNIPPMTVIAGDIPHGECIEEPFHIEQGRAYGKHCYRGPKPPFNWNHRYQFTIYALDCELNLNASSKKEDLLKAMEGHVLDMAELFGKYQRRHK